MFFYINKFRHFLVSLFIFSVVPTTMFFYSKNYPTINNSWGDELSFIYFLSGILLFILTLIAGFISLNTSSIYDSMKKYHDLLFSFVLKKSDNNEFWADQHMAQEFNFNSYGRYWGRYEQLEEFSNQLSASKIAEISSVGLGILIAIGIGFIADHSLSIGILLGIFSFVIFYSLYRFFVTQIIPNIRYEFSNNQKLPDPKNLTNPFHDDSCYLVLTSFFLSLKYDKFDKYLLTPRTPLPFTNFKVSASIMDVTGTNLIDPSEKIICTPSTAGITPQFLFTLSTSVALPLKAKIIVSPLRNCSFYKQFYDFETVFTENDINIAKINPEKHFYFIDLKGSRNTSF